MLPTTVRWAEKKLAIRCAAGMVALFVVFGFSTPMALGQCSLGGTSSTWANLGSGTWSSGIWNPTGAPNSSGTNVCITDNTSTVTLDITASVASLQLASGNGLTFDPGTSLSVNGPDLINAGQININGGGNANTYMYINNSTTLMGGGTLTLSTTTTGGGGNAYLYLSGGATLDNVDNTIQGEGIIYNNGATLINEKNGIINANSTGSPLISTLTLEYGTVNNAGLMEASNNGVLQLYANLVNNAGGTIEAHGAGAYVQIYNNTDIQGGTLTNNGGAFLGTPVGWGAYLDGSTGAGAITLNGTYTSDYGSATYLYGSIINNNNLQVNGGGNYNTYLYVPGSVSLTGGGTVNLSTTTNGGGNAYLYLDGGAILDNVNNTIQGEGIIYNNGGTINNHVGGIINANSSGSPLITTLTLEYGVVNNAGLMEATGNGVLQLYGTTVNNAGGTIEANGAGAYVQIFDNADIVGGTLTNNGGAFLGTPSGYTAYLDGSTGAGAITLNGTYTSDYGSATYLYGPIINNNNLQVNGGGNYNTYLYVPGSVSLTGGGGAWLYLYGGATLDNVNNTIQGEGIIYNNGATLINEAGGTILANSTGSPLISVLDIYYGTVTNNGTLQVNSGNLLHLFQGALTNFGGNTLTGGTYNVYGTALSPGTLQIDALGNTGGEIVNNAATILLGGPNSNFLDQNGLDALSNFSNNLAAGSFTIQNGRNFTSPGDFANAGAVQVGAGSTFTTGASGTNNYNQSGGSTKVNGALAATTVAINGGTLSGSGIINANVQNTGGTVSASDPFATPTALTINGNYTQGTNGTLEALLAGTTPGTDYSLLVVNGTATLDGTLDVDEISGFQAKPGEDFFVLTSSLILGTRLRCWTLPTRPCRAGITGASNTTPVASNWRLTVKGVLFRSPPLG